MNYGEFDRNLNVVYLKVRRTRSKVCSVSHLLLHISYYVIPPTRASVYPCVQFDGAQSDATNLPSRNKDIKIEYKNVKWLPWAIVIGTAQLPYVNGEEALFVTGTNKVGKIRITDWNFSWVDEIMIPNFLLSFFSPSLFSFSFLLRSIL